MKFLFLIILLSMPDILATPSPLSHTEALLSPDQLQLTMPVEAKQTATSAKLLNPQPSALQIARTYRLEQDIATLANWNRLGSHAYLRLHIQADTAKHLNFHLSHLSLPASAELYFIDAERSKVLSHYSASELKNQNLWTPVLNSNQIILEINVANSEQHLVKGQLAQVGLGTRDFKAGIVEKSGSCNIDVVCPEGDDWRNPIRSVARFIISDSVGSYACTGTLLNNEHGDQNPLFLTAAHCQVAENTVDSMVFYWNYETSTCGGTPDGDTSFTQTGADFIARGEGSETQSDYALVKLKQKPAAAYNVYYSGWNATAGAASNVATIHHPSSDEKRISFDYDDLSITPYAEDIVTEGANFYRIGSWDQGTTEGGSSGAGLWNQSKQLIGTLSGGSASCSAPTEPDWYGRLSSHWLASDFDLNQLAKYLSPISKTPLASGLSACEGASLNVSLSTSHPGVNETFSFNTEVSGGLAPYEFNWDFDSDHTIDSTMQAPQHSYPASGLNQARLEVIDSNQCKTATQVEVIVPDNTEIFMRSGQIPSAYQQPAAAQGSWVASAETSSEGDFSLRSQIINADEVAAIVRSSYFQNGTLSFDYRVSSELNYDLFKFYIDEVEQLNDSGQSNWTTVSYRLAEGNHSLRWSYEKDESLSEGADTVWIDNVQFTADPTPTPQRRSGGGSSSGFILLLLSSLGIIRALLFGRQP